MLLLSMQNRAGVETLRRRDILVSTIGVVSSLFPPLPYTSGANAFATSSYQRITSTKKIARYIRNNCAPGFLSSVMGSGYKFLYRGLSPDAGEAVTFNKGLVAIVIKDEPHDLLCPDTYGSSEAASYFKSLEEEMTDLGNSIKIKPSNSHIGTTCPMDAARWGRAASVWPLGNGAEFAWLESGGIFWPLGDSDNAMKRRIIASNERLADALLGDAWEIMFRADEGFLAVPAEMDDELRATLIEMS
ncbi:hypothetical protein ACHAWF_016430 [Thalassiosira exigua]